MGKRFAVGGLLVVALTCAGVVGTFLVFLHAEAPPFPPLPPIALPDVPPGKPQSILVLGTDKRYGDKKAGRPVRSDTMMVVHLDPDRGVTAVMSLPRDLVVSIPGHGRGRINGAYAAGGAKLAVQTVNRLGFGVSHVIGVDFGGFRRAVNRLGCVYVDVDRRYFNDNDPPVASDKDYATIDLRPGYQRLCGQDALDYVRFRHLDDDFVRAARQQDFLRQAKSQIGVSKLIDDRRALLKILADYSESDLGRASDAEIFGLVKLAYASSKHPVQEVPFPPTERQPDESLLISHQRLQQAIERFKHVGVAGRAGARRSGGAGARHHAHALSRRYAGGCAMERARP
jgi:LCP family protein required for cell wall assembly